MHAFGIKSKTYAIQTVHIPIKHATAMQRPWRKESLLEPLYHQDWIRKYWIQKHRGQFPIPIMISGAPQDSCSSIQQ